MFTREIKSMPDYKIIKSSQIILFTLPFPKADNRHVRYWQVRAVAGAPPGGRFVFGCFGSLLSDRRVLRATCHLKIFIATFKKVKRNK